MAVQLNGKVAIVTGGGRGIGRSESLALAAAGARVVVNDLGTEADGTGADERPADDVVAAICEAGGEAVVNYGDVSRLSTGTELVSQALDTYGRLDILVNNAGILRPTPFLDLSEEDWDVLIATHLRGHFSVAQAAAKIFVKQYYGRLVNTSSEAGLGMPLFANYGSAKEGITGLTRTLALELAPYHVTVNQIRPRSSNTRMYPISIESGRQMGAALTETLPGATGQGLFTRPEDFHTDRVASLVVFLCTDAAAAITNGDFIVGGGEVTVLSHPEPVATIDWSAEDAPERLLAALGA
ncbi:SDR family NAD(P)-dependent oxidoreductase [Mycobacterium marseillense]|uniref:SDR family NAD(P)-dependent oxidoreductase n=1 Tax=Mycobacterium marseillense TaxID=701042 RepID=UPI0015D1B325|nr:SDR family NAD(P)-dependent oxidoreductase [Mycobacterium marseillense]